jgi:hypothetical protein
MAHNRFMDNDQLLDQIQKLLKGMELRTDARFGILDAHFEIVETKLESISRKIRLARLENPNAA